MTDSHAPDTNSPGSRLVRSADYPEVRVEYRRLDAGRFGPVAFACDEVVLVAAGRTLASRTANGCTQRAFIQPGLACIRPRGTHESGSDVADAIDTLHLRLSPSLIACSASAHDDIDPGRTALAYAGWLADPMLRQIALALAGAVERAVEPAGRPAERLFIEGMRCALVGHLLGHYTVDRWRANASIEQLDARRLKRVLDLIEARLSEPLSLRDLAVEACLSEFHFARMFRGSTGLSPHRYVTRRRVETAQAKLARTNTSQLAIALDTGFGSQAAFIRAFRKSTGLTPGQYRGLHRNGAAER